MPAGGCVRVQAPGGRCGSPCLVRRRLPGSASLPRTFPACSRLLPRRGIGGSGTVFALAQALVTAPGR